MRDGDRIRIEVNRSTLEGSIHFIGENGVNFTPEEGSTRLALRPPHPQLKANPALPDDTRLWAALQQLGGGTWGGCVYDVDAITSAITGGRSN